MKPADTGGFSRGSAYGTAIAARTRMHAPRSRANDPAVFKAAAVACGSVKMTFTSSRRGPQPLAVSQITDGRAGIAIALLSSSFIVPIHCGLCSSGDKQRINNF